MFGHEWVLWVLAVASAMDVVEEHTLGWQGWAAEALGTRFGVRPTWTDFWARNGFLIVLACRLRWWAGGRPRSPSPIRQAC